jgi:hypothetical protein
LSWDAGAITGTLGLDANDFAHGILQAQGFMSVFPSIVVEFMENPILGAISIAKEAASAIGEIISGVANDSANAGKEAERAGVSVKFFSEMEAVGKRVGVAGQSVGEAFKFMARNAAEAVEGVPEAGKAFDKLGISVDFLKEHLNDSEAIFKAVHAGMQGLPSSADRTRVAMEVLGRGGADMVPIFKLGTGAINEMIETAHAMGATVDDSEVATGRAFASLGAQWDEMWDGLKKEFAKPILDELSQHAGEAQQLLMDVAHVLSYVIPAAVDVVMFPFNSLATVIQMLATAMAGLFQYTDKWGWTDRWADAMATVTEKTGNALIVMERMQNAAHDLSGSLGKAGTGEGAGTKFDTNVAVQVGFDTEAAAQKVGDEVKRAAGKAIKEHSRKLDGAMQRAASRESNGL